jgi:hypothetical protein
MASAPARLTHYIPIGGSRPRQSPPVTGRESAEALEWREPLDNMGRLALFAGEDVQVPQDTAFRSIICQYLALAQKTVVQASDFERVLCIIANTDEYDDFFIDVVLHSTRLDASRFLAAWDASRKNHTDERHDEIVDIVRTHRASISPLALEHDS